MGARKARHTCHMLAVHDHLLKLTHRTHNVNFLMPPREIHRHLYLNENIRHVNTENMEYIRVYNSDLRKYHLITLTFPSCIFIRLFRKVPLFSQLRRGIFYNGSKVGHYFGRSHVRQQMI